MAPALSRQKLEMLLNILLCIGQHPTTKDYLAENVNRAMVEKPCFNTLTDTLEKTFFSLGPQCFLMKIE